MGFEHDVTNPRVTRRQVLVGAGAAAASYGVLYAGLGLPAKLLASAEAGVTPAPNWTEGSPVSQMLRPGSSLDGTLWAYTPVPQRYINSGASFVNGSPDPVYGSGSGQRTDYPAHYPGQLVPYLKLGSMLSGGTGAGPGPDSSGHFPASSSWIMRDASGAPVIGPNNDEYMPDLTNATVRAYIVGLCANAVNTYGQAGVWLDNVLNPFTQYQGTPHVTQNAWFDANATLVEQIRAAIPSAKINVNVLIFAPRAGDGYQATWQNPYWQRVATAVSAGFGGWINREITPATWGGTPLSGSDLSTWFSDIENGHAYAGFIVDTFPSASGSPAFSSPDKAREYDLAAYYLVSKVSNGIQMDLFGDATQLTGVTPYAGYALNLGAATGARTQVGTSLTWTRAFANGFVAFNGPSQGSKTITLPAGTYKRVGVGSTYTGTITLGSLEGAVLTKVVTGTAPVIGTIAASPLSGTAEWLLGDVNLFAATTGTAVFQYGTTTSYGTTVTKTLTSQGTNATPFSLELTGLTPGTIYHWTLTVTTAGGSVSTGDMFFATKAPPKMNTLGALPAGPNSETLAGNLSPFAATSVVATFRWGLTTAYGSSNTQTVPTIVANSRVISYVPTGLTPATTYHYNLTVSSCDGTWTSADQTFTTSAS
jgi:hypothetical protein